MAEKKGKILVVGSIVIDTILSEKFFGGTGGNIAYGLGKLKSSPLLFSLAGKDFNNYGSHLKNLGVDVRVHIDKKSKTASFSCTTNKRQEQNGEWEPNAYKNINKISLTKTIPPHEQSQVSIAIFSPGTPESTIKHLREFRNHAREALVIFDPGQMINHYSKKQLLYCVKLANIFIVNEMEYGVAGKILENNLTKIIENKIIIKTLGEKGSIIFESKKITKVPAVRPHKVIDTMGAGDAYRAGLIYGLWSGRTLPKACALGAKMASKNIEHLGCQKY